MRFLVCGRGAADPRDAVWFHLVGSLRHLGHEVIAVDPTSFGRSGLGRTESAAEALDEVLTRFEPHVMIHVPSPGDLLAEDVRRLTAKSQTIAVALHQSTTLGTAMTRIADAEDHLIDYDLVCVSDRWTHQRLEATGGYRVVCLPPAVHAPGFDAAVPSARSGVVVVGEPDDRGADLVRAVVNAGVDVRLYGSRWSLHPDLEPLSFPRVSGTEMATVLAGAELHLELPLSVSMQCEARLSAWEAPLGQTVFDAAAVGTPSLTLERAGARDTMTPGLDIATFAADDDVASLVPLLLADSEGLAAMGEAALDTVRSAHLWTQRWEQLFGAYVCPDDDGERVTVGVGSTAAASAADRATAGAH